MLAKTINGIIEQLSTVRDSLKELIITLPDNPNIKRLDTNQNIFTISAKDMGNVWCPNYHDFRFQYNLIAMKLDSLLDTPKDALRILNSALNTGRIKRAGDNYEYRLHPDVIDNVRNILKGA